MATQSKLVARGMKEESRRPICPLLRETDNDIEFFSAKLKVVEAQILQEPCLNGHVNSTTSHLYCESCESLYDLYSEYHLRSFDLLMEEEEALAPNYRAEVKPKGAKRDSTCWNHAPTRRRDRVQSKRLRASARDSKSIE